jgi:nicotinamidase/pyrazinamidase
MQSDRSRRALLIVDVQNDFCPGGALAVREGEAVVEACNRAIRHFDHVILTQDWHPEGHVSFASSWPGKEVFAQVEVAGIPQTLWPEHCVAGSPGADFHPGLETRRASHILRKGRSKELDSYSAFLENDRKTVTGLEGLLRSLGITDLFLAGLATDYCVLFSGLDALAEGFRLTLLGDAVRGVDLPPGSAQAALDRLVGLGARILNSEDLGEGR